MNGESAGAAGNASARDNHADAAQSALAPELRALVKGSVELLGEVIQRELGPRMFWRVEHARSAMAALRGKSGAQREATLKKRLADLRRLTPQEQLAVAHSFSLMLELMNACESAYRTYRLAQQRRPKARRRPRAVIYVLTAHPTEARAPANIAAFHAIQRTLTAVLSERVATAGSAIDESFARERPRLLHELEIAWRLGVARSRKPRVQDEAEHLYSILLRHENLEALLDMADDLVPVFIRTWVGGDKDGHPFVDERVMAASLQLARTRLVRFARAKLGEVRATAHLVGAQGLVRGCARLELRLRALGRLAPGDGVEVRRFHAELQRLASVYGKTIGEEHPSLARLRRLVFLFPALVVPLELRESSDILVRAASASRAASGAPSAIVRMVARLARLSRGADPRWYARGLIISMASELAHVQAAMRILARELGGPRIPVIPLFEQAKALEHSQELVRAMLADHAVFRAVRASWGGRFEVMLGYSDSAKEMGALASRVAIADAMHAIDRVCRAKKVTPVFFHGSGGSIDRGGGSIREQTEWWPASSLALVKATIQGEMVERTFAGREILRSGIEKLVLRTEKSGGGARVSPAVRQFAARASLEYRTRIASKGFLRVIEHATAYQYLQILRLGSRPTARSGGALSVGGLRAIPWVLSWTQVRVLFPTWWGLGTAWAELKPRERTALKKAYGSDPLFRSFLKLLGFTLAKVELPVWNLYLAESGLPAALVQATRDEFAREHARALELVRALSGSRDPVWFRPWLGESVVLRSPMIHPLNLLQILALERCDASLIRETVTGIASGMMTTG